MKNLFALCLVALLIPGFANAQTDILRSSLSTHSPSWSSLGGRAPMCADPRVDWLILEEETTPYDVLNLFSGARPAESTYNITRESYVHPDEANMTLQELAEWRWEVNQRFDGWRGFTMPTYISSLDASMFLANGPMRGTARVNDFNFGLHWNFVELNIPGVLDILAGLGGVSFPTELRTKYETTYCMDYNSNFHATVAHDMRLTGSNTILFLGRDSEWISSPFDLSLEPRRIGVDPTFPVGRLEARDLGTAELYAKQLYRETRLPNPRILPNINRWDVVLTPFIEKTFVRIWNRREDMITRTGPFEDGVAFRLGFHGRVRKQVFVDARLGSQYGVDRGDGGSYMEVQFISRGGRLLNGNDEYTRDIIAKVAGEYFATTWVNGSHMVGNISDLQIPLIEEYHLYENDEFQDRLEEGCEPRQDYDCVEESPLYEDIRTNPPPGLCPVGYVHAIVDARSATQWNWDGIQWTRENYQDLVFPDGNAPPSTPPEPDGVDIQHLCALKREPERDLITSGDRGEYQVQSREERLICRREGTCNNNFLEVP